MVSPSSSFFPGPQILFQSPFFGPRKQLLHRALTGLSVIPRSSVGPGETNQQINKLQWSPSTPLQVPANNFPPENSVAQGGPSPLRLPPQYQLNMSKWVCVWYLSHNSSFWNIQLSNHLCTSSVFYTWTPLTPCLQSYFATSALCSHLLSESWSYDIIHFSFKRCACPCEWDNEE